MTNEYPNLEETIQAYVLGNLSVGEKDEFEEYFLTRPEIIDQIQIAQKVNVLADFENDQSHTNAHTTAQTTKKERTLDKLLGWLTVPIPAIATVAAIALLTPMLANQFASREIGQIELAAFSSSVTRGESQSNSNQFDIAIDLSTLGENAAIMIKVTPDFKQSYRLEVYNASEPKLGPIWKSPSFSVKSGTRDQIILLPDSVKIPDANLRILGKEQDGSFRAVKFCHYSETCL